MGRGKRGRERELGSGLVVSAAAIRKLLPVCVPLHRTKTGDCHALRGAVATATAPHEWSPEQLLSPASPDRSALQAGANGAGRWMTATGGAG